MLARSFLFFLGLFWICYDAYATLSYHTLPDNSKIRTGSWKSTSIVKGTIILMIGRGSYLEKNLDFIQDLTALGYNVESFDWRGHGGSDRLIPNSQKCHIDSFDTYLQDFDHYFIHTVKPNLTSSKPVYLMGVSMGGHLAVRYIHDHPDAFKKVVLVVPMFDVVTKPFPKPIVKPMVTFMSALSFGKAYAFGYGDVTLTGPISAESRETHDYARHIQTHKTMRQHPELVVGGPTFDWVKAAFKSIEITKNPLYFSNIAPPVLIQTAGKDMTVDIHQDKAICQKMANCQHIIYPESRHNITKESDSIRNPFLKDLDLFLSQP